MSLCIWQLQRRTPQCPSGPLAAEQRVFQAPSVLFNVLSSYGMHHILLITHAQSSMIWPAQPRVRVLRGRVRLASARYLVSTREANGLQMPWRRLGGGGGAAL